MKILTYAGIAAILIMQNPLLANPSKDEVDFVTKLLKIGLNVNASNVYQRGDNFWFHEKAMIQEYKFTGFAFKKTTLESKWESFHRFPTYESITKEETLSEALPEIIQAYEYNNYEVILSEHQVNFFIDFYWGYSLFLVQQEPPEDLSFLITPNKNLKTKNSEKEEDIKSLINSLFNAGLESSKSSGDYEHDLF